MREDPNLVNTGSILTSQLALTVTTSTKRLHADAQIGRLIPRLRKAGLRMTAQRLGVFQALRSSRSHPTVEELYQEIRKRVPNISRNTIYLNLGVSRRMGETSEVQIGHDADVESTSSKYVIRNS